MVVGVLGLGSIGTRHAANLRALGHDVIGVDADGRGRLPDVATTQAVLICTPASTHAAVAEQLRQRSYDGPLFVEKPLALSTAACAVFRGWPHPTTMVGYQLRFHPLVSCLRSVRGTCGSFRVATDMGRWPGQRYGPMLLECSHEIDLALACGAPDRVLGSGLTATSAAIQFEGWSVRIDTTPGCAYLRDWSVSNGAWGVHWAFTDPAQLGVEMYRDEVAHFLACAASGTPTACPFSEGLRVLDVCEQVRLTGGPT